MTIHGTANKGHFATTARVLDEPTDEGGIILVTARTIETPEGTVRATPQWLDARVRNIDPSARIVDHRDGDAGTVRLYSIERTRTA